jgi:ribosomal-protein-alanine N-acetyltransferase
MQDAKRFYSLNLNPNVIQYTGNSAFANVDESKDFLENYQDYTVNGYSRWAVIYKENQEFLGWCGLKHDKDLDEIDIGFRFFKGANIEMFCYKNLRN